MAKAKTLKEKKEEKLRQKLAGEMLRLSTNAFGLVAALAWNEFIKTLVAQYIKPFVGDAAGLFSLLIYALIVTALAVTVTYQLSKLVKKD